MAGTICKCGAVINNMSSPSDVEYYIFSPKVAEEAIKENPKILLMDFETEWDELNQCEKNFFDQCEFWFCHECKRMMVFKGRFLYKRYKRIATNQWIDEETMKKWSPLYVYSDIELEDVTEKYHKATLKWFLENYPPKYDCYISPNQKTVVVCDHGTKDIKFVYISEVIDLSKYKD